MNFWQFASNSNGAFLLFMALLVIGASTVRIIRIITRHLNIRKHGWPPAHCNADGEQFEDDGAA